MTSLTSSSSSSTGKFYSQPDVIITEQLSFLGMHDLADVSSVSRRLNALANDPKLWESIAGRGEKEFDASPSLRIIEAREHSASNGHIYNAGLTESVLIPTLINSIIQPLNAMFHTQVMGIKQAATCLYDAKEPILSCLNPKDDDYSTLTPKDYDYSTNQALSIVPLLGCAILIPSLIVNTICDNNQQTSPVVQKANRYGGVALATLGVIASMTGSPVSAGLLISSGACLMVKGLISSPDLSNSCGRIVGNVRAAGIRGMASLNNCWSRLRSKF